MHALDVGRSQHDLVGTEWLPVQLRRLNGIGRPSVVLFPQVVPLFRHRQLDSLRFERIDVKGTRPNDFLDRSQGQTFLGCFGSYVRGRITMEDSRILPAASFIFPQKLSPR